MLPTICRINKGGRPLLTTQTIRIGPLQLFFSYHDTCSTCESLIGFRLDGQDPVVCDVTEKIGETVRTTEHRTLIEPDRTKWLSPREFERKWMELNGQLFSGGRS